MTGPKPKFLKSLQERLGPHWRDYIDNIVYIYGSSAQSKGGSAKAANVTAELENRNKQIKSEFSDLIKSSGLKRHVIAGKLATKHKLSAATINKILRKN